MKRWNLLIPSLLVALTFIAQPAMADHSDDPADHHHRRGRSARAAAREARETVADHLHDFSDRVSEGFQEVGYHLSGQAQRDEAYYQSRRYDDPDSDQHQHGKGFQKGGQFAQEDDRDDTWDEPTQQQSRRPAKGPSVQTLKNGEQIEIRHEYPVVKGKGSGKRGADGKDGVGYSGGKGGKGGKGGEVIDMPNPAPSKAGKSQSRTNGKMNAVEPQQTQQTSQGSKRPSRTSEVMNKGDNKMSEPSKQDSGKNGKRPSRVSKVMEGSEGKGQSRQSIRADTDLNNSTPQNTSSEPTTQQQGSKQPPRVPQKGEGADKPASNPGTPDANSTSAGSTVADGDIVTGAALKPDFNVRQDAKKDSGTHGVVASLIGEKGGVEVQATKDNASWIKVKTAKGEGFVNQKSLQVVRMKAGEEVRADSNFSSKKLGLVKDAKGRTGIVMTGLQRDGKDKDGKTVKWVEVMLNGKKGWIRKSALVDGMPKFEKGAKDPKKDPKKEPAAKETAAKEDPKTAACAVSASEIEKLPHLKSVLGGKNLFTTWTSDDKKMSIALSKEGRAQISIPDMSLVVKAMVQICVSEQSVPYVKVNGIEMAGAPNEINLQFEDPKTLQSIKAEFNGQPYRFSRPVN